MVFRAFLYRPIPDCACPCRAGARSRAASKRPSRMRSISQPKDRSATWCRAIAEGTAGPSPPATRRASLNTSRRARRFRQRGFSNLGMWTRGVDTDLFRPDRAIELGFTRPIFISVGRLAVEKNLDAFLSLDLPGTKVVIGTGPEEAALKRRFPQAKFLGLLENGVLAAHLAAADVFVFPSRTDTFGVVQLEALASGVPVAAFPVT